MKKESIDKSMDMTVLENKISENPTDTLEANLVIEKGKVAILESSLRDM